MVSLWKKEKKTESTMPITGHLVELRSRLIKSLVVLGIFFGIALQEIDPILKVLKKLLPADLYFNSPSEALWVSFKVAFFAGFFVSFPFVLFQVWKFISPGLEPKERKWVFPFILGGSFFFVAGVLFCYFVVLPFALSYLVQFGVERGIKPQIILTSYIDFILKLMMAFGLIFMIPIALILLAKAGIVSSRVLAKNRRYAILINSIIAAVLTPTPDVFNMMLMMIPLLILYELGIWGIRLLGEGPPKTIKGSGKVSPV
ncbi:MAG: twin-arginine translocase subunit TatC [Nitrospirae bacterium]|nr:twin-arginine translocase subunit TatC [Nitrospirota bacterium]MBI3351049.1 twin-arginine translocase subunit TatC [Nitrospirota bacterium]